MLISGSKPCKRSPPDIAVYIPKRIAEDLGAGTFVAGYGAEIHDWIHRNGIKDPNFPPGLRKLGFDLVLSKEYARKMGIVPVDSGGLRPN
jgi:hypothetical protein